MQYSVTQSDSGRSSRIWLGTFAFLFVICALGGGSSRVDATSQPFVQSAAIIVIGVIFAFRRSAAIQDVRPFIYFGLCCGAIIAAQLVPLPFDWWAALPGHALFANGVRLADSTSAWRPVTLTPDLTVASLLSLLPPIATVLAMASLTSRGRVPALVALGVIIFASALMGLLQLATGSESLFRLYEINSSDAAIGLFANRNHHAMLMAIGIPVVAVLTRQLVEWRIDRRFAIALGVLCALLLVASVLVAGSRGGVLLTVLALPLAWVLGRASIGQSVRSVQRVSHIRLGWYAAITVAIVLGVVVALTRTASITRILDSDPLADQRFTGLSVLTKMIRDFFPLGSGFGSFASVYRAYEPLDGLSLTYLNQAHNDLLQLVIEGGIPAFAMLLVCLCWWLTRIRYLWFGSGLDNMRRRSERLGTVIIGMLLLGSILDYPLRTPLLAVIFALAATLAGTSSAKRKRERDDAALP